MNIFDVNLNLYRSFYYVAKYGGFTKGSEHAFISQSSLSNNIKKLEEELGVKLFNRKNNYVILTSDGQELFSKLEKVVEILRGAIETKEITIGCIRFIADNYLCDAITEFKNNNKDIRVNIRILNPTDLYQGLKKEELDLIICRYPLHHKFEECIKVEKITDIQNIFVCTKNYIEQEESCINENYEYPLLLPDSSNKRRVIEQYLIDNNIKYKIEVELPNSNLLKKLILNGVGIGYINKKSVQDDLDSGKLIIHNYFKKIPLDNISIIYNSRKDNIILNQFIKILKTTIENTNS